MAITTDSINKGFNQIIQSKEYQAKVDKSKESERVKNQPVDEVKDNVQISQLALEKQRQEKSIDNVKTEKNQVDNKKSEDIRRSERIDEFKTQIKNGQFRVDSNAIANKLLSNKDTLSLLFDQ